MRLLISALPLALRLLLTALPFMLPSSMLLPIMQRTSPHQTPLRHLGLLLTALPLPFVCPIWQGMTTAIRLPCAVCMVHLV